MVVSWLEMGHTSWQIYEEDKWFWLQQVKHDEVMTKNDFFELCNVRYYKGRAKMGVWHHAEHDALNECSNLGIGEWREHLLQEDIPNANTMAIPMHVEMGS